MEDGEDIGQEQAVGSGISELGEVLAVSFNRETALNASSLDAWSGARMPMKDFDSPFLNMADDDLGRFAIG
ncbi:hypothetical protein AJ79_07571 [Helicocarpus griseus UAMH5409]|uniref:Uncharacterized protein n=1 Tax=Helicocarpus griseus UAMH5409 TaxID=1447875 RepID=A0A2B7X1R7_9EURO|nr:hypothetical protein AJ79_07571 [Helicocarpus griseus UAMH5409]